MTPGFTHNAYKPPNLKLNERRNLGMTVQKLLGYGGTKTDERGRTTQERKEEENRECNDKIV